MYGSIEVPTIMKLVWNCLASFSLLLVIAMAAVVTPRELPGQDGRSPMPQSEENSEQSAPRDVDSETAALQKATPEEIQTKLRDLRTARIAALRKAADSVEQEFAAGIAGSTVAALLDAHAAVAEAELEDNRDPVDRIRALKVLLNATIQFETEVRNKYEAGFGGYTSFHQATAARMKAQTRLAKEILSQKEQMKSLTPQR